ncbi:ECF-type sigma factor [Novosphingobium cyanobacteriorum]|uniref:ECF-type sigma factor n=1 Tax=Novosphingobium cyanobacteriorum TaxID=3024215 RepID=A0ABT6CIU2_9SPHN|nr:ECF-type sigma factor [Novosphingobium cyanobacteriorum]MDF8333821.1 ECF-type sigma factor [Novosphingobium cyanobacteriorum]
MPGSGGNADKTRGDSTGAQPPVTRDAMLAAVYDELRQAAARLLRREAAFLTMQPTELVNEAALRVLKLDRIEWADQRHVFATGARILRQAMIDAIRQRRSRKRQVPDAMTIAGGPGEPAYDVEALDAALTRLEQASPDLAALVELRFFVGLSVPEVAALWDESESTVKRRWKAARLWLAAELRDP